MRHALPAAVTAVVLALVLCACGGSGGSAGGGQSAFPVTVEHRYGTTEIPRRPKRVVTVGRTDQDVAVALGVAPVGVRAWFGDYPFAAWPWAQPALNDANPAIVGDARRIDITAVRALRPDVILAMDPTITSAQYQELSRIAPTVAEPTAVPAGTLEWVVRTRLAGRALGLQAEAGTIIAAAKHDFLVVRDKHPGFATKTIVVAARDDAGAITIYGPRDGRAQLLAAMGFKTPPWVAATAGERRAFILRPADAPHVAADRIVWIGTASQRRAIVADPVVARMPVTATGKTTFLPQNAPPVGAALEFDTLLSMRYAVHWAEPLLAPAPPKAG